MILSALTWNWKVLLKEIVVIHQSLENRCSDVADDYYKTDRQLIKHKPERRCINTVVEIIRVRKSRSDVRPERLAENANL